MRPVGSLALWFGLWGAPVVWSLQVMLDYAVAAHACYPHRTPLAQPAGGTLDPVTIGAAAVALLIAVAALAVALRSWWTLRPPAGSATESTLLRDARDSTPGDQHLPRMRFMAAAGIMTGAVFTFGVVLNVISPALVPSCQ